MLTFGSLFSGIGGLDLGLERAGMQCVWQCEIDDYARRVLAKHWPDVRRHDDVRTFPPTRAEEWQCDIICGGFPCQDISKIGDGAGMSGQRSGLWGDFARIVGVVRPQFVIVENVATLLGRGLGRVLGDLATLGFDAEWHCFPATSVGAPHKRERVWVVAHRWRERLEGQQQGWAEAGATGRGGGESPDMDSMPMLREPPLHRPHEAYVRVPVPFGGGIRYRPLQGPGAWLSGPRVFRVANGVPDRMDRLRGLGNAVVPQIAEWIGGRIVEFVDAQEQRANERSRP